MPKINDLKIKIFADGADPKKIYELNKIDYIKGFTTNPSLMRKAGITDYKNFAIEILKNIKEKPISFEVFSDEINIMEDQAKEIASWGKNVNFILFMPIRISIIQNANSMGFTIRDFTFILRLKTNISKRFPYIS